MNIIIPMAGIGKRLRPHTLTTPKPLLPIAGKPIVQRLVEDIAQVCEEKIEQIGFVVGHFGEDVEENLRKIAASVGAKGRIYYQEEALGTAHAIFCAKELLQGKVMVAFADTLFRASFKLDTSRDGIIWVQKVKDPSAFGVIKLDENQIITDFVEKPKDFVSDLAIIGVYYLKDGMLLKEEIQYLIDHDIKDKGEFQLTDALENMRVKGVAFVPGEVSEWLDCGNKDAIVYTNQRYLEFIQDTELVAPSVKCHNSVIIPPCYIGENVTLNNTVIGPYVSIGEGSIISDARIQNTIIQKHTVLKNVNLTHTMIGNFVNFIKEPLSVSLGDFNKL